MSLEVEDEAKEADAVWMELQHPLMQACEALRRGKRGVVGGGIVGFAESMMHIHDGLKVNMRQADEMVSDLRLRAASGGREVEEGVVTAGERALRYKGEVCMDLCAKIEAIMDPHADPDQVQVLQVLTPKPHAMFIFYALGQEFTSFEFRLLAAR